MVAQPGSIPDLKYAKADGTLFERIEMEKQMRETWPKVHWLRIKANKIYGLQRQAAWGMLEPVLRHWVLDEMVRRGQVSGDILGVNVQSHEDENEQRQFVQRLVALVQAGKALIPQEGEGIDMSQFPPNPTPPGPAPNGSGQPQSYSPPQPPPTQIPPGYGTQAAPPMPQHPQYPTPPPSSFGPPGFQPQGVPQPPAPPTPPVAGAPAPGPGRGRGRGRGGAPETAVQPAPTPAAQVPPMAAPAPAPAPIPSAPIAAAPAWAPLPAPPAPTGQAAPIPSDGSAQKIERLSIQIAELSAMVTALSQKIDLASRVATVVGRAMFQKDGELDAGLFLKEIGRYPQ